MTVDESYFEVTWQSTGDATRVASPVDQDRSLVHRFRRPGTIDDQLDLLWQWPNEAHLPTDIVVVANGIRVVSPRLRQIFDEHATATDIIQWFPATVVLPSGQRLPHWVPHFPQPDDLVDPDHSTFGPGGLPIRYALSREKLRTHAVTVRPNTVDIYIVSQLVAEAIQIANLQGVQVTPVRVT